MYLRNLQQVENEGSYRGISCVQARRIARFVQHFRKDTSEMRASEGRSSCRTVDRLQAGFRMQR